MIWTIVFVLTATAHLTNSSGKESKRCFVDRVHKMIAYNCASLGLKEIPKYLKTTTEVSLIRNVFLELIKQNYFLDFRRF